VKFSSPHPRCTSAVNAATNTVANAQPMGDECPPGPDPPLIATGGLDRSPGVVLTEVDDRQHHVRPINPGVKGGIRLAARERIAGVVCCRLTGDHGAFLLGPVEEPTGDHDDADEERARSPAPVAVAQEPPVEPSPKPAPERTPTHGLLEVFQLVVILGNPYPPGRALVTRAAVVGGQLLVRVRRPVGSLLETDPAQPLPEVGITVQCAESKAPQREPTARGP
jgi:hypothetical protein